MGVRIWGGGVATGKKENLQKWRVVGGSEENVIYCIFPTVMLVFLGRGF